METEILTITKGNCPLPKGSVLQEFLYNQNLFKESSLYKNMNKWLEIFIGMILVIVPIYVAWGTSLLGLGTAALEFLKGGVIWFIIMIGLLFLMLGISDLKE